MLIILLVLSRCQIPIYSLFRLFAMHLAPAASALQLLKFRTRSLLLFERVQGPKLCLVISRLTISSRPYNPLNAFLLAPQIRLLLTTAHVYKVYLLTYSQQTRQQICIKVMTEDIATTQTRSNTFL